MAQQRRQRWGSLQSISCVGSYMPRRCGIATFTADLTEALNAAAPQVATRAVAMNDRPEGYRYGQRVGYEINEQRPAEYRLAADFLNTAGTDAVLLQHEFGIFGGAAGAHVIDFLKRLNMPVIATLHTVLREPEPHYREVAEQLFEQCDRLVVMAQRARGFLQDIYNVPDEKIKLIHHGIPDVPFGDPNFYKDQFQVEGKKTILTFGLLGPSKGLENMIEALPAVVAKHPDVVYMILGATHPGVIAHMGESYREGLKQRAKELGVDKHIRWFDKFVELDELVEFLGSADVYVTPYENEAQITSGTLAYALGTGKATVSTPYWYAQEMLADGRGSLVPFKDTAAMSAAILELFDNEVKRHAMRKRAYQYTREMRWETVAGQYLDLCVEVREQRARDPRPVALPSGGVSPKARELAAIKLDHLRTMTDGCGVIAHAVSSVPDRRTGYTTDDNAAALRTVLLSNEHQDAVLGDELGQQASRYLAFLHDAFDPDAGRFRGQMAYDRTWDADHGSEDTHGRALWALGATVARSHAQGHVTLATHLFHQALPACEGFVHTHGIAYALIGIHAYLRRFSGDSRARHVREKLAQRLFDRFRKNGDPSWPWPNDEITYDAARLPHALLLAGRWMFNNAMIQQAIVSLEWLHEIQAGAGGRFAPVGSEGWLKRGGRKARFHQMPDEAAATIDASLEAARVTGESKWLDRAQRCIDWFLGDNDLGQMLYDPATGGCCDKLQPHGSDANQSARATCAWLLSLLSMYDHAIATEHDAAGSQPAQQDLSPTITVAGKRPAGKPVTAARDA
ncbi:glycosyltransferase family 4 protein [Phycisphaeraceae bacterium D3-23]